VGIRGYTGGLPDVLASAAEQSWGHEHDHCEPRSPAPHRPVSAPVHFTGGENAVVISPDGKLVATGDNTGYVRLWNLATGRQAGAPLDTGSEIVDAIAFNAQGTTLAVANEDGSLTLWNTATGTQIGAPLGPALVPTALAFNPAGTVLAASDDTSAPILWDVTAWHGLGPSLNIGDAASVIFGSGATQIAAMANDESQDVQVWDLPAGNPVGTLPAVNVQAGVTYQAVIFSPDGKILAAEDSNGHIRFWDAATLAPAGGLSHTYPSLLAFSPDGKTIVTGEPLQFWNAAAGTKTGRPLRIGSNDNPVDDLAFSPDGKILATTQSGELRMLNAQTRAPIGGPLTISGADEIAFSPNGQELATGDLTGTARLWNVATRTPSGPPLDAGDVDQLAFSPNGQFLATATSTGTIQLWDAATGAAIGPPLSTGTGQVLALAFNTDGTAVVTATASTVQQWDISFPADLTAAVCRIAGGPLSQAEWKYYVPSEGYQPVCPAGNRPAAVRSGFAAMIAGVRPGDPPNSPQRAGCDARWMTLYRANSVGPGRPAAGRLGLQGRRRVRLRSACT
jgi:WD40 repeat protein